MADEIKINGLTKKVYARQWYDNNQDKVKGYRLKNALKYRNDDEYRRKKQLVAKLRYYIKRYPNSEHHYTLTPEIVKERICAIKEELNSLSKA